MKQPFYHLAGRYAYAYATRNNIVLVSEFRSV